jgi:GDPmannose 4,6-dehydratase
MLQQEKARDVVVGTGEVHSVREFLEQAFGYINLDWRDHVEIDSRYFRPTEVPLLRADGSLMKRELGWEPVVTFQELVRIMMDADLEAVGITAPNRARPSLGRFSWLQRR